MNIKKSFGDDKLQLKGGGRICAKHIFRMRPATCRRTNVRRQYRERRKCMYRFLMIEDDLQICEVVQDFFARESKGTIQVETAQDGEQGLEKFYENEFDLVLLDIMLPGMNGLELCRYMRRRSVVPIIFLTAKDTEQDMMQGYATGCDDYMVKPFSLSVLYAKCLAIMKRAKGTIREDELVCDAIRMNVLKYRVTVDGKEVDLSPKEFALLRMLLENKGTLLLRERLLIGIWGYDYEGTDRCVDNHVRKLRKHLGNAGRCIKTVVGKGYKIEETLPKKGA